MKNLLKAARRRATIANDLAKRNAKENKRLRCEMKINKYVSDELAKRVLKIKNNKIKESYIIIATLITLVISLNVILWIIS